MDSQAFHLVEIELSHAGETSGLTPEMLLLEELRITPEKELPTMDFLFRLFGRPCFPRGELVAITGKAKSGKTFVTSMLMSCCARSDVLSFSRQPEPQMRVLWYDTEQSEESTQDILRHRIIPMVGPENYHANLFDIFNVRSTSWKQRMGLLEQAVGHYRPDMVIVDGIRDLVDDINDGVLAQEIVERLMRLASKTACCIVCVLHQNKSEADRNMRGSIGTELTNKAFEVYQCEMIEESETFKVTHTFSRKQKMKRKLYYRISEDGLPDESADFQERLRDEQGRFMSLKARHGVMPEVKWESFNQHYIVHEEGGTYHWDLRSLFEDAMEGRSARPYRHFMAAALKLSHIVDANYFYHLVDEAENKKIISKMPHPGTSETWVVLKEYTLPF